MRILLDTQVFLWFLADSPKLSKLARKTIEKADEVFVSAASIWEATIKAGIGKLEVDPNDLIAGIEGSGFKELSITAAHAAKVFTLPHHHRDPFDRLLVAQAMQEPMKLLSADSMLGQYSELVETI